MSSEKEVGQQFRGQMLISKHKIDDNKRILSSTEWMNLAKAVENQIVEGDWWVQLSKGFYQCWTWISTLEEAKAKLRWWVKNEPEEEELSSGLSSPSASRATGSLRLPKEANRPPACNLRMPSVPRKNQRSPTLTLGLFVEFEGAVGRAKETQTN